MIRQVQTFSDSIQHLHATADGLWIAHQGGVTLLDPKSGQASKWTVADGLPAHPANHLATSGGRVVVATPNGVAWCDDVDALIRDGSAETRRIRWQRGLTHPRGAGAYVNGVGFVNGKIYAATGGGRMYREGAAGFELLELPLRQARLVRIQQLASSKKNLRLLVLTNNSGVLMLATGANEEPSLYQWGEEEGLCSRYVTALATTADHVAIAVQGCVHLASQHQLVESPETMSRWGRITLGDQAGPADQRIPALCEHEGDLYVGTVSGLYRVPADELGDAAMGQVEAERIEDSPIRQLASCRGELWLVHGGGLARYSSREPGNSIEGSLEAEPRSLRERFFRRGFGSRGSEPVQAPPMTSWRGPRFTPEPRWRIAGSEPEIRSVRAMAVSPDGVAIGGEAGRVAILSENRWTTEIMARLRRPPDVDALAHDPENASFWAATRYGLYQRDPRGRWHRDVAFPGRTVHGLCVWGGSVIAHGSAGLHAFVQNEWRDVEFGTEPPPIFVAAASEKALALAGRPGGGFYVWRAGRTLPEPVPIDWGRANCMSWGDDGMLWLGGDRGFARWDGSRLETFSWGEERHDHVTAVLVYDGRLIVGSQGGVWTAEAGSLTAASGPALESQGVRLGLLEGLPDAHVTSLVVHDSEVWVGTQGGIAILR